MSTDELMRLRRAFTATFPNDSPRVDCPPAARIWEGYRGELGPTEFRELVHHLAICPLCSEAWRLAAAMEEGDEEDLEEETPQPRPSAKHGWLRYAGTAAAAVVVLAVGIQVMDLRDRPDALRTAAGDLDPGDRIELLSEGPLPRDDFLLRWRGPEGAVYYDLRVSWAEMPSRTLAEDMEVREPQLRVAPEALAEVPPGALLLISVEAFDPIGGSLASDLFRVTVQ